MSIHDRYYPQFTLALIVVITIILSSLIAPARVTHARAATASADNTRDFPTIGAAVAALKVEWQKNPSDTYTVYVYDASPNDQYSEGIVIDYPVSLIGVSGSGGIIVNGGGGRPLTVTGAGIGRGVVISGITFAGGEAVDDGDGAAELGDRCGGGVLIEGASPTFVNNVVRDNYGSQFGSDNPASPVTWLGGGICLSSSNALVAGNTIVGNGAAGENSGEPGQGGAIYVSGGAPVIRDNHIVGNFASDLADGRGGGVALFSSNAVLEGNTIAGNVAARCLRQARLDPGNDVRCQSVEGIGGGAYIDGGSPALRYNRISGNNAGNVTGSGGGAVALSNTTGAVLLGNEIVDNIDASLDINGASSRDFRSSGLRIDSSVDFLVDSNIIARNRFLDVFDPVTGAVVNNRDSAGVNLLNASRGLMRHNTIADNGVRGGTGRVFGIQVSSNTQLTLANTVFAGHDVAVSCESAGCGATVRLTDTLFDREAAPRADPGGPWFASAGDRFGDPRFVAPGDAIPDYRIRGDSPARDAGQATDPAVPGDVDHNAREIGRPDLGAHEFPYTIALSTTAPAVVGAGQPQAIRLRFEVVGNVTAPGAALQLTLPAGTTGITAGDGGSVSGTTVSWAVGDLAPGQPRTYTIGATAPATAGQSVAATARMTGSDGAAFSLEIPYRVVAPGEVPVEISKVYLPMAVR